MSCVDSLASQFKDYSYYLYPVSGTLIAYQGYMGIPQYYRFQGTDEYLFGVKYVPHMMNKITFYGRLWLVGSPGIYLTGSYTMAGGIAIQRIKIWVLYNISDIISTLNMLAQIISFLGAFGSMFTLGL